MLTNVETLMPLDGEDKLRMTASNLNDYINFKQSPSAIINIY
jgi:hypothetical protein